MIILCKQTKKTKNRSTLPAGGSGFKTRLDWSRFSCFSRKWPSNCCSLLNKRQTHRVVFCILFYKVIVHSEVPVRQKKKQLKLIFLKLYLETKTTRWVFFSAATNAVAYFATTPSFLASLRIESSDSPCRRKQTSS